MVDLDQSGRGFQRVRTYLGPSLGWTDELVQPATNVTAIGTYVVKPGDQLLLVNVAGTITIQLPDVRTWVQQNANQPATGFTRSLIIKDIGGNAQGFPISIVPFSAQVIDGIPAPVTITVNRSSMTLYPMIDMSGWIVQSTAVGGPGASGDVFKTGNNTFTGTNTFNGPILVPTMSLDDGSPNAANTAWIKSQGYATAQVLSNFAPLNSPQFTGTPTAPTPMPLNSDGSIATTFYVNRGFQPLDGDLTALAAAAGTNTLYYRSGANAWSPVVVSAPLTFSGGVLGTAAGGGNVSSSGSPISGQIAQWTGPASITGVSLASLGVQPLDPDLTAIANLTDTNSLIYRVSDGSWGPVVIGSGMTFASGILSATNTTAGNVNSTGGGYAVTMLTGYADATGNLIRAISVGAGLSLVGSQLTCTVSTATFAPIDSPTFTTSAKAPTPITSDNSTNIATTAFVKAQGYTTAAAVSAGFQPLDADLTSLAAASSTTQWYYRSAAGQWDPVTVGGGLTFNAGILSAAGGGGNVSSVGTPAATQLAQWTSASQIQGASIASLGLAPIDSPTFTTSAKAPTPVTASNTTDIATTAFVKAQGYAPLASPAFTGNPTATTQTPADNSTKLATTAYVDAAAGGGSGFSTGDVKITIKTVADTGWVMMNDSTIGNTGSGATYANLLANALFVLIYNNINDTNAPVQTSGGGVTTRGVQGTAATAWTNNCRLFLPKVLGRAMAGAGTGTGLTARLLGATVGEEGHVQTAAEMATHNHTFTDPSHNHAFQGYQGLVSASYFSVDGGGTYNACQWGGAIGTTSNTGIAITINNTGGNGAANVMQPTTFLNFMIKL